MGKAIRAVILPVFALIVLALRPLLQWQDAKDLLKDIGMSDAGIQSMTDVLSSWWGFILGISIMVYAQWPNLAARFNRGTVTFLPNMTIFAAVEYVRKKKKRLRQCSDYGIYSELFKLALYDRITVWGVFHQNPQPIPKEFFANWNGAPRDDGGFQLESYAYEGKPSIFFKVHFNKDQIKSVLKIIKPKSSDSQASESQQQGETQ